MLPVAELVEPLRCGQVLEAVLAQVAQERPVDQRAGGGGDEHLAPVARRRDPGCPVHVDTDVALLREQGRTGVEAHAHPDRPRGQCLLRLRGSARRWSPSARA